MDIFSGFEWLLIDLANQFGLDSKTYDVRLGWARENLDYLEDIIDQAENQATFLAAVLAVRDAQAGIPSGYMVELDAICSGPQLLSVMTRCEVGMENTGAIGTDTRADLYTKTTDVMGDNEYERKVVKPAIMP